MQQKSDSCSSLNIFKSRGFSITDTFYWKDHTRKGVVAVPSQIGWRVIFWVTIRQKRLCDWIHFTFSHSFFFPGIKCLCLKCNVCRGNGDNEKWRWEGYKRQKCEILLVESMKVPETEVNPVMYPFECWIIHLPWLSLRCCWTEFLIRRAIKRFYVYTSLDLHNSAMWHYRKSKKEQLTSPLCDTLGYRRGLAKGVRETAARALCFDSYKLEHCSIVCFT